MEPGAGSCTRSTTAISYANSAAPDARCGSVVNACNASNAGDIVRVAAGAYGDQTNNTCNETSWVTYYLESGAVFTTAGGTGQYQKFVGGTISSGPNWPSDIGFSHQWFENNNMVIDGDYGGYGNVLLISGATDVTLIGPGEIRGKNNGTADIMYIFDGSSNVTIDGFDWHDMRDYGQHQETLRIDGGLNCTTGTCRNHDIVIRNNRFHDSDDSTSTIFLTQGNHYAITIEGNSFSNDDTGTAFYIETQNPSVTVCDRYNILYNSFNEGASNGTGVAFLFQCASSSNVVIKGNVGARSAGCGGATWSYNVWQASSDAGSLCGTGDVRVNGVTGQVDNIGFVSPDVATPDLHLAAGSAARNAGDPSNFPATDIDHDSRALPAGNNENVDSGADERD